MNKTMQKSLGLLAIVGSISGNYACRSTQKQSPPRGWSPKKRSRCRRMKTYTLPKRDEGHPGAVWDYSESGN